MSDQIVTALARKWCRELWGSHSGTEREIPFEDCQTCRVIFAAIQEALEIAEKAVCFGCRDPAWQKSPVANHPGFIFHHGPGSAFLCSASAIAALRNTDA